MKNNFVNHTLKEEEFTSFAANLLFDKLKKLSQNKNKVFIALSGGSTPLPILDVLKNYKLNWECFTFFMVDERNVPIDNPKSNYGNINKIFFRKIKSESHSIINNKNLAEDFADNYEKLILSIVPLSKNSLPTFDLVLLGIGDDGHTASLFPNTKGIQENEKIVIKNWVHQLNTDRITLTYPIILNASEIIILAKGKTKHKIVEKVLNGTGNKYPVAKIINSNVNMSCVLGVDL